MSDTQLKGTTTPKEIEKIIETEIAQGGFDFIERKEIPGFHAGPLQTPGLAWRKLPLSKIRGWAGLPQRTEDFDEPVLLALNSLCRKGMLLVFDVRLHCDLEYHDALICCEIGHAVKDFDTGNNPPTIKIIRAYSSQPLTKKERTKPHVIADPKKAIQELRERRDAKFRRQFGWSNEAAISRELRKIDRLAAVELYKKLEALIEKK